MEGILQTWTGFEEDGFDVDAEEGRELVADAEEGRVIVIVAEVSRCVFVVVAALWRNSSALRRFSSIRRSWSSVSEDIAISGE